MDINKYKLVEQGLCSSFQSGLYSASGTYVHVLGISKYVDVFSKYRKLHFCLRSSVFICVQCNIPFLVGHFSSTIFLWEIDK